MSYFSLHAYGGSSVVRESLTTHLASNRKGFLDGSNRWEGDEQWRVAEALLADRENAAELNPAEKKLLKMPEGKGE